MLLTLGQHVVGCGEGERHGLLAHGAPHTGLRSSDHHLLVQRRPYGHAQQVQVLLLEHRPVVAVGRPHAVLLGELAQVPLINVRRSDQLHPFNLLVSLGVGTPDGVAASTARPRATTTNNPGS